MPDIIGGVVYRWPDELCVSCKAKGCDLIESLKRLKIETVSGCKVFACGAYEADTESPFYELNEIRDKTHNKRAEILSHLADLGRLMGTEIG